MPHGKVKPIDPYAPLGFDAQPSGRQSIEDVDLERIHLDAPTRVVAETGSA